MIEIQRPSRTDGPKLSEIAFTSKAHWGYDEQFMEQCRQELTVSGDDVKSGLIGIAVIKGSIVGFYKLSGKAPSGELAMLFVHPDFIGQGIGKELLSAAKSHASGLGIEELVIDSDPNAEGFYIRMGASKIGESPSGSIPGRKLPKLLLQTRKE